MPIIFKAGLRGFFGSLEKHNTLEIAQDHDGNYLLVIQEKGGDMGNMRSGSVRIEAALGDPVQAETHSLIQDLVDHIHEMHKKHPKHPAYVVEKNAPSSTQ